MSEWKTMETAPKDRTEILLATPVFHRPVVGFWQRVALGSTDYWGGWWSTRDRDSENIRSDSYTHWMPLPALPKSQIEE